MRKKLAKVSKMNIKAQNILWFVMLNWIILRTHLMKILIMNKIFMMEAQNQINRALLWAKNVRECITTNILLDIH